MTLVHTLPPKTPKRLEGELLDCPDGAAKGELSESTRCLIGKSGSGFGVGPWQGSQRKRTGQTREGVLSLPALVKSAAGKHPLGSERTIRQLLLCGSPLVKCPLRKKCWFF